MIVILLFLFSSGSAWEILKREAVPARFQALAESTKSNLVTHFKAYLMFCVYFGLQSRPFVEENLVVSIQLLARSFKSPSLVKNLPVRAPTFV